MRTVYEELKQRGLLAQTTNANRVQELFDGGTPVKFYIGFDATAESLHVGHFLQLTIMKRLQQAGHIPVALLGTGTTMVGDPTGKTDMRKMLTVEEINYNAGRFLDQMSRFVDFSEGKGIVVRNGDWLMKKNYIDFLREVGVYFSVNRMLTAECFKTRLEKGLSFIEFNYMLMQSYDFLQLYQTQKCLLELGGDDQWSNIINGVDLVRRVTGDEVYGQTFTLLTTKEGKKMGKTEKGALWLDENKTSPYEFFQYWRNVADDDVINCMKMLTFMPLEEIWEYEKLTGSDLNAAKEKLAHQLTMEVHGKQAADAALDAAKALFGQGTHDREMPTTTISEADLADGGIDILTLLVKTGLAPSRGEGRRLIDQGGVSVDDQKVGDIAYRVDGDLLRNGVIVKKGKKTYHKVVLA